MRLLIVSDESGFPEMALKSVCLLYGDELSMNILRINLVKHLENTQTEQVKWSKMRAKKKYLGSILQILTIVNERKKTQVSAGIWAGYGTDCLQLYKEGMNVIQKIENMQNRIFNPDKNLSLKRHTDTHIFAIDSRFESVYPKTAKQEPLIIIADILAGIYRLHQNMPVRLIENLDKIIYTPDKFKAIVAQQAFSLGLFSE